MTRVSRTVFCDVCGKELSRVDGKSTGEFTARDVSLLDGFPCTKDGKGETLFVVVRAYKLCEVGGVYKAPEDFTVDRDGVFCSEACAVSFAHRAVKDAANA